MKLREKQTADRRRRILDAAEELIRQTGGAGFSMLTLADRAEVSPATPYNLFGSKTRLLFALFNQSLTELPVKDLTAPYRDPLDRLLETTRVISTYLATRADFFRPLYRALVGAQDDIYRPEFVEYHLQRWKRALADVERARLLASSVTGDTLARQLMINFAGTVELWLHQELDADGFAAEAAFGTTLLLLGATVPDARPRLLKHL
ncbi:MAG: TetR/AcrR family transcriptional regulator, partial [Deltaproteobacteria bacterium]|nr:TetR/AcrR family transcriptional regulator [Deltaproteobacteria bacterium]